MAETTKRVVVVTGGNKGIGLAIVRGLCSHFGENGIVYLTARDEGRGRAAVAQLQKDGLSPLFYPLDVTDKASISKLRDHLEGQHGGCDVLVNNAGLGPYYGSDLTFSEKAKGTMACNFYGLLDVSRALIPLIRSGGRVVHVSSAASYVVFMQFGDEFKTRFRKVSNEQDVIDLMEEYAQAAQNGETASRGWPGSSYETSKLGVVSLTACQSQKIQKDGSRKDILINNCCPGFVDTEMTTQIPDGKYGPKRTVSEGADTPIYLATLPAGTESPQGQFLLKRKVYDFIHNDVQISFD